MMRFSGILILGLFLGVSGVSADEPEKLIAKEMKQPTVSENKMKAVPLTAPSAGIFMGSQGDVNTESLNMGSGHVGAAGGITMGGATEGSIAIITDGKVIPYNRDLLPGTLPRTTIIESLKGMKESFPEGGVPRQVRMASEIQGMIDFLQESLSSLGSLNLAGVEVVVEKEETGGQTNKLNVINRDGQIAELKIVYPVAGNIPSNVKFNIRSVLQSGGSVPVQLIKKYVGLYGDSEGQGALDETIKKLKKGGKITGSFYYWAPVPTASYMDFISVQKQKSGISTQRTLRVWGDGRVTYTENETSTSSIL